MKYDLANRNDIELLVNNFYSKAIEDEVIGHFFKHLLDTDLESHLTLICDFWDSILFGTSSYRGNVMLKHIDLSKLHKIEDAHFDKWLDLWTLSIDNLFDGPVAENVKSKAKSMADLMKYKIGLSQDSNFIQ